MTPPAPPLLPADDHALKHIVVRPDQVHQRDPRPWRQTSLEEVVIWFLLVSSAAIALGAGALAVALRLVA